MIKPTSFTLRIPDADIADLRDRLAPGMEVAALAEGDQLLDNGSQILRLRERGDDLLMLDQSHGHVREHGAAMLVLSVELAMGVTVPHVETPHELTTEDRWNGRP